MKLLSVVSLKSKTLFIAMTCSIIALAISFTFNTLYQSYASKNNLLSELNTISTIIADRSVAALQFDDEQLARQNLATLSRANSIMSGCLYTAQKSLFTDFYNDSKQIHRCPEIFQNEDFKIIKDHLFITQNVVFDEEIIGYLYLDASLVDMQRQLHLNIWVNALIVFLASIIAFLFATKLEHFITKPINKLKETASLIQDSNDYSMRASKVSNDEIGSLVDSFNEMLNRIESDNHALSLSEQRFKTLTTSSSIGIFQLNKQGKFEYVNSRWLEITGLNEPQSIQPEFIELIHPNDQTIFNRKMQDCLKNNIDIKLEFRLLAKTDRQVSVIYELKALNNGYPDRNSFLGSLTDITELSMAQEQLKQLALYDSLTQLPNRYLFINRLDKAISQIERDKSKLAVFFLDIDNFKKVNDTLGHDQGDELLCQISSAIEACIRPGDSVARMGGDEFTILIPNFTKLSELEAIASKLLEQIRLPIALKNQDFLVSASIGIAVCDSGEINATEIIKNADIAMYRAKSSGRNNYQFFSDLINDELLRQLDIENKLRGSIINEDFKLHFQPQVCTITEEVTGFEALVRWYHPELGLVRPADFITIAEDTGLILPIGEIIIKQACMAVVALESAKILLKNARISINISAKQFQNPDLVDYIQRCLIQHNIKGTRLEVEITESILMENLELCIDVLLRLRKLGITSSIDDFGTGYSSLNYLKRLPIQILKVDRTFVKDIPVDRDDMEITAAIIAMAHKLGLKVIAEGVETTSQIDFLKLNKCDYIQGYYYGKPISLEALIANKIEV